jgi:hypothetical protein
LVAGIKNIGNHANEANEASKYCLIRQLQLKKRLKKF